MCRNAKEAGIRVFGISDHWVIPPHENMDSESWAMAPERLPDYIRTLQQLRTELQDENFSLKIGLEVDFFFENIDQVLADLEAFPLDYLIGSVHYSGIFPVDYVIEDWLDLDETQKAEICETYYRKLSGAAERREFAFIGHLDLPKKFGLIDNRRYFPHAVKVLDILQKNGGAIEVNTAGYFKECAEAYPAPELLAEAFRKSIPVIVSADAHHSSHLRRNFDPAAEVLKSAGYQVF
jgi:histidinol-phosphatase (PHP family)